MKLVTLIFASSMRWLVAYPCSVHQVEAAVCKTQLDVSPKNLQTAEHIEEVLLLLQTKHAVHTPHKTPMTPLYTIDTLAPSITFNMTMGATLIPWDHNQLILTDMKSVARFDRMSGELEILPGAQDDPPCLSYGLEDGCPNYRKAAVDPMNGDIYAVAQFWGTLVMFDGKTRQRTLLSGTRYKAGCFGDGVNAADALYMWIHDVKLHPFTGDIYVADAESFAIRKIDRHTGIITTVAGTLCVKGSSGDGGPATEAKLGHPCSIHFDSETADMYIADYPNHVIYRVDNETGWINVVAGQIGVNATFGDGGLATDAGLDSPAAVAVDKVTGDMIIAQYTPVHIIRRVSLKTGIISTIAGIPYTSGYSGDGGPALEATLHTPRAVEVDPISKEIIIADSDNTVFRVLSSYR